MGFDKNRILDVAKWQPPTRIIKTRSASGVPIEVIEKVPGMLYEQWLNPSGDVIRLPLGNANWRAEGSKTPYFEQIKQSKLDAHKSMKLQAGWLPWGRCPVAMVMSQEVGSRAIGNKDILAESPCVPDLEKPFGPNNPCKHAIAERDWRKARHNELEESRAESYKKEEQRDREQRDKHHGDIVEAMKGSASEQAAMLKAVLDKLAGNIGSGGGDEGGGGGRRK